MRISDWSSDVCSSDLEMERRASALPNPVLRQAALTEITRRRGLEDRARTAREGELWDSAYTKLNSEDPFTPLEKLLSPQELNLAKRENRRSEEHTSELQSLMRISYAVFCLKKK